MAHGGRYLVDENGKRKRVAGTQSHPEGDRPRDSKGRPLNQIADEPAARPASRAGKGGK